MLKETVHCVDQGDKKKSQRKDTGFPEIKLRNIIFYTMKGKSMITRQLKKLVIKDQNILNHSLAQNRTSKKINYYIS